MKHENRTIVNNVLMTNEVKPNVKRFNGNEKKETGGFTTLTKTVYHKAKIKPVVILGIWNQPKK